MKKLVIALAASTVLSTAALAEDIKVGVFLGLTGPIESIVANMAPAEVGVLPRRHLRVPVRRSAVPPAYTGRSRRRACPPTPRRSRGRVDRPASRVTLGRRAS